jgi:sterol desaturase/sphingolipid hydroxylase (fatty acid hydroxylase superfamily)
LLEPLRLVNSPDERLWWPALVGALLVALVYELIIRRKETGASDLAKSASLQTFLHRSSLVDIEFIFIRAAVRIFVVAALPFGAHVLATKTVLLAYDLFGEPVVVLTGTALVVAYSVLLFLVSDFSRYLVHRWMHRVSLLWRFHQVHHSAEVLTPLTLHRIHPVEQVIQTVRGILVIGGVGGIAAWFAMGQASPLEIYGVPAVMLAFNVLGANLRHSHVWLPYPSLLERVLISPAQHQQHHGNTLAENESNYGSVLAIWDWFGGSLRLSKEGEPAFFGLEEEDCDHDPRSAFSALVHPFVPASMRKRDQDG